MSTNGYPEVRRPRITISTWQAAAVDFALAKQFPSTDGERFPGFQSREKVTCDQVKVLNTVSEIKLFKMVSVSLSLSEENSKLEKEKLLF